MEEVRVRFAPSPTGYLHIGGARTALFNWLFARHNRGKLVLRIEDTDSNRMKEDSVAQILGSLRWLGVDWDEGPEKGGDYGPYYQSQRQEFYTAAAKALVEEGKAYYCFCSEEELAAEREVRRREGLPLLYSGKCRSLAASEVRGRLEQGLKPVIRLKVPECDRILVKDMIRGTVSFPRDQFDDFIIVKSNGLPAYNFACVVDDHAMRISHVIRAEEHLPNTPKQQLIYEALAYEIPQFAHLSMILAPDRSKLSKRHGATSVSEFKEMGCLPEAVANYLTLLGWSPAEEQGEIISPAEVVPSFSLEKVSKTAAIYDLQKLFWLNGRYITDCDLEKLALQAVPFLLEEGILSPFEAEQNHGYILSVLRTVRDRVKTLKELAEASRYFFRDIEGYEEKGKEKYFGRPGAADLLAQGRERLAEVEVFTAENTERAYRDLIAELAIKGGQLIHPTRLALTGRTVSPGLFEVMGVLGRERCLDRLEQAVKFTRLYNAEKKET
ncbi:Glutamate-tRNA ligase [Acididesulfobacillus acetoxydans]|uniref:Glutamate--tRNA ligase n=1 Tax=Acididesulfobacillus acetoxydans TaxID=1561005 RepID=A0A8S0XXG8_9FIRM|nr:glutamate--tRNA ligase [Acididesulfobacillus acetoxydans]CAA7601717.1 Glutamate-tRNA ligase [Acididesulfobacillus acetoxydans]CEJ09064.1 Glutamate--tRNA ligase [Acididesulfobacillus acetoxydans]